MYAMNKVITAPHFGNDIWHGFDLVKALKAKFGKPVRLLNDADMQGLAAIQGNGTRTGRYTWHGRGDRVVSERRTHAAS